VTTCPPLRGTAGGCASHDWLGAQVAMKRVRPLAGWPKYHTAVSRAAEG